MLVIVYLPEMSASSLSREQPRKLLPRSGAKVYSKLGDDELNLIASNLRAHGSARRPRSTALRHHRARRLTRRPSPPRAPTSRWGARAGVASRPGRGVSYGALASRARPYKQAGRPCAAGAARVARAKIPSRASMRQSVAEPTSRCWWAT